MAESIAQIPGFEKYTIDTNGVVINTETGKRISYSISKRGYVSFRCCKRNGDNKIHKRFLLHRTLLELFIGNDPDPKKCYVDHIDNNPRNNSLDNLRWVTQSENVKRAYDQGRAVSPFGTTYIMRPGRYHPRSKPVEAYDGDHNLILAFESVQLAKKAGYHCENALKNPNKKCHGLTFKYA